MPQKAKDDTPEDTPGTADPARAGQSARRRVLGDRLRAYYDAVASEPVPDAFADLLDSLATSENKADQPQDDGHGQDRS